VIAHDTPDGLKRVIGGQRVRIRPADPNRADDVRRILHELTGSAPGESGRCEFTARVQDDAILPALVQRVTEAGIHVHELSLHLPTLDEVFLTLTGKSTAKEAA
jgi:oleandomycin transport system ATP-binding protein